MALELNHSHIAGVIAVDPVIRIAGDQTEILALTLINTVTRPGRDPQNPTVLRTQIDCDVFGDVHALAGRLHRGAEVMIKGRIGQDLLPEGTPGSRYRLKVITDQVHLVRSSIAAGSTPLPLNVVTMTGTLLGDPAYRMFSPTRGVAMFTIRNEFTRTFHGASTQTVGSSIDCEAFGRLVDFCRGHLRRGAHVVIEGRLQEDRWETNGEWRSKLKVEVEHVQLQRLDIRMSDEAHARFGSTPGPSTWRGPSTEAPPATGDPFPPLATPATTPPGDRPSHAEG